jgi:hypothetical protein
MLIVPGLMDVMIRAPVQIRLHSISFFFESYLSPLEEEDQPINWGDGGEFLVFHGDNFFDLQPRGGSTSKEFHAGYPSFLHRLVICLNQDS